MSWSDKTPTDKPIVHEVHYKHLDGEESRLELLDEIKKQTAIFERIAAALEWIAKVKR